MGQNDDRRTPNKGRSHKKLENNENKRENITPKVQPTRVVLKSNSTASKTAPRITLRTTPKTTPKSPWTMRETPPSRGKETSSATRHTISSQRSTPASHTKNASLAMVKATIRAGTSQSTRGRQTISRQQGSTKRPPSANHMEQRSSRKELFDMIREVSASSIPDSDAGSVLRPRLVSINADAFKDPSGTEVPSDGELDNDHQIGGSPFYTDGELNGDDLESRMRSFLKRHERSRVSRRSEIKAVKWDPAIVACGPLSSITNNTKASESPSTTSSHEKYNEPTKDLKYSLDNLHQIAADLKKADKRILQQLLEALKGVDSSDDTTIIRPKKKKVPLSEQKSHVKASNPTTAKSANPQQNKHAPLIVKGLNPEAPIYRNFAIVKDRFSPQKENKENIPQGAKWPLNVQRKRPHSIEDGHNVTKGLYDPAKPNKYIPPALRTRKTSPSLPRSGFEPIWVKKDSFPSNNPSLASDYGTFQNPAQPYESLIDAPLEPLYSLQPPLLAQTPQAPLTNQPILPPSWMTGFQNAYQPLMNQPAFALGPYDTFSGYGFQPNAFSSPVIHPAWCPAPIASLPTLPLSDKSTKSRAKKMPGNVIPSETGPGRESLVLEPAWSTQLLDNFMAKYPKTGTKKPLPKLTKEKKIATHIQQKLEVLLYQQKEKKAMEDRFGPLQMMGLPRIVSDISMGSTLSDSFDASVMS